MSLDHRWEPLERAEVSTMLSSLDVMWWFAGGQAIDAFLGFASRDHGDIDVACLRRDQMAMQRQLGDWDLWCSEAGELRPWREGEWLATDIHDIWCRPRAADAWRLQLMLDESDGRDWVYRRDARVRRPLASLCVEHDGDRYLAVEVQLLYKAPGAATVEKDAADFQACLPRLDDSQRAWLAQSLGLAHAGHGWLRELAYVA